MRSELKLCTSLPDGMSQGELLAGGGFCEKNMSGSPWWEERSCLSADAI